MKWNSGSTLNRHGPITMDGLPDAMLELAMQMAHRDEQLTGEMRAALLALDIETALNRSCQLTGLDPTQVLQALSHSHDQGGGFLRRILPV